ncbi:acylneuraminate cytidylyltransferase family protein [Candidatus Nucleicultrix amoebiphila]|uniref:acylneuraminate cytidylyltransferase family protein n=1 Tax=Candidatus Nucleicultrix amoebiphila TaxID=1509244 RepID=UPI000A26F8DC|nr:cytidylyltransferase [Candidatus Nucleicultrix amoebiphila]
MICALMIGRANSVGFPGKNIYSVLGRPLCSYPLMAAQQASCKPRIFVSTDCPQIKEIALTFDAQLIERPPSLTTSQALGEDVFLHGYKEIKKIVEDEGQTVDYMILLFANAATITANLIDQGISILEKDPSKDSAVTTSIYNMWSPLRARKLDENNCLKPFVPFETFGDPKTLNCDRDSQGDVYYADMSASIVRPKCLDLMQEGLLPQKWMGQNIASIPSWGGCDVDYQWQIPTVEYWLKAHGYTHADLEQTETNNRMFSKSI